jgi:hypothetical protein
MSPVGFEPTISAGKRSQTYDLVRPANETGSNFKLKKNNSNKSWIDSSEDKTQGLGELMYFII